MTTRSLLIPAACTLLVSACEQPSATRPGGGTSARAADASGITVLPQHWSLRGFAEDKDLSGMASWDGVHCLVCSDELRTIQTGIIRGTTVTGGGMVALLPGGGNEVDAEGVAVSHGDGCYYVTGSHGVGRKNGEMQASRCTVFRVPVHAGTGEPSGAADQGSLLPWVRGHAVLGPSVGQPLQANGFNIEGLTHRDGRLWFGVRAPNLGGDTFVIEAAPASLFGGPPQATLHRLPVGPGLGIREITALREGFLVVTGTAASDAGRDDSFAVWFWTPGGRPRFAGELPALPAKAEGLYLLNETADHVDALVICDGTGGGSPKAYRIPRR